MWWQGDQERYTALEGGLQSHASETALSWTPYRDPHIDS